MIADFEDHAAVRREDECLLAGFRAGAGTRAHDRDFVADGLFHQLRGGQQVEVEVLLDDGQGVFGRERDGFGTDLRRHVLEFHSLFAAGEIDGAVVLHQGEIVGIDGDGEVLVVGGGQSRGDGRCGAGGECGCDGRDRRGGGGRRSGR